MSNQSKICKIDAIVTFYGLLNVYTSFLLNRYILLPPLVYGFSAMAICFEMCHDTLKSPVPPNKTVDMLPLTKQNCKYVVLSSG